MSGAAKIGTTTSAVITESAISPPQMLPQSRSSNERIRKISEMNSMRPTITMTKPRKMPSRNPDRLNQRVK